MTEFASFGQRIKSVILSGSLYLFPLLLIIEYGSLVLIPIDNLIGTIGGVSPSIAFVIVFVFTTGLAYRLVTNISIWSLLVGSVSLLSIYFAIAHYYNLLVGGVSPFLLKAGGISIGLYILGGLVGGRLRSKLTSFPRITLFQKVSEDTGEITDEDDANEEK